MQLAAAATLLLRVDLPRHLGGAGAGAGGVGEDVNLREAACAREVHGLPPFVLRLARETGDDVGADIQIRDSPPGLRQQAPEFLCMAASRHAPQHRVGAALQRQMQVRQQARVGEQAQELVAEFPGLQRAQAQPRDVGVFKYPADQSCQVAVDVAAVAAEMDARQHGLLRALLMQGVDLRDDLRRRAATLGASRNRDDAKRAAITAAVLHLDEGAVASEWEQGAVGARLAMRLGGRRLVRRAVKQLRLHPLHESLLVAVVHEHVDAFYLLPQPRLQSAVAAADHEFRRRITAAATADQAAGFARRLARHRAGVDDEHIRRPVGGGEFMAALPELPRPLLQFGLVEAAAQGFQRHAHYGLSGAVVSSGGRSTPANARKCSSTHKGSARRL